MWKIATVLPCLLFTSTLGAPCQSGWVKFGSSCYFGYIYPMYTYSEAQTVCEGMRATLVTVKDAEENLFLKQYTRNTYQIWIGLDDIDVEGTFEWNDGSAVKYTNWENGQPDNAGNVEDCAHLWADHDGKWNDLPCTNRAGFVCERKSRD
ncbi:perlucin-like protein [Ptychodera flava]|uniref:perlucin-like protein n=1 Tax=Ptychodera flava TaxID=63121 RepID=UPI00396A59FA